MVQLGPDTTRDATTGAPSRNPSGYAVDDGLLRGFSATHLSGAGCRAFGDVPVLPWTDALPADPGAATVPLDHSDERAAPGWYAARLGNGVDVSLTADERAGLAVYRFPEGASARLLVKGGGSLAGARDIRVSFPSRRTVAVSATSGHFCGSPGEYDVHVLLRFDHPVVDRGTWSDDGADGEQDAGAWVDFGEVTGPLRSQVAVSFVDPAGARGNLEDAALGWSYPSARAAAERAWQRELDRIRVQGGDASRRSVFDAALYHALLHPTLLSDADGRYPGFDGEVQVVPAGRRHYTAISGWDAYRTHLPLIAWLRPDVASDVARSLIRAGREGGWLPKWPLVASYTGIMNGDSAAPMIAAVRAFGARDFPLQDAVEQLARQADETSGSPGQGWFQPRPGLAAYLELGYVPDDLSGGRSYGASTTLEYAVDDFALSRLATAAGRPGLSSRMLGRSGSWANLFDPERRLLLPRDSQGAFPGADYDPGRCCIGFEEGNAVQYSWGVPHDMAGLLEKLGEHEAVQGRLDTFHEQLNAFLFEPHAWLGNQPSFATPWTYHWLGAPWATQDVVADVRDQLWAPGPQGLPGNDDLGSLSAWYVWASLGLYPLTPGTAVLGLGVPGVSG
jgi:predicted alpha-1,2-mannosidase